LSPHKADWHLVYTRGKEAMSSQPELFLRSKLKPCLYIQLLLHTGRGRKLISTKCHLRAWCCFP
jgi:hypothetical protein